MTAAAETIYANPELIEGMVRLVPIAHVEDGMMVVYGGAIWTYEGDGRIFSGGPVSIRIGGIEWRDLFRLCIVYPADLPEEVGDDNYPVKFYPLQPEQWERVMEEERVNERVLFEVVPFLHCPATFSGLAPDGTPCENDGKTRCNRLICYGWTSYEAKISF